METKNYLAGEIRKWKRKINLAKAIDYGLLFAAAGGILGIFCEAASLFREFYYADLAAAVCFGAGLFAGICLAVIKRADMAQAAGKIDSFGLKERMLTAYERRDEEDEFSRLLREDAADCYGRMRERIRIPLLPCKRHVFAFLVSVIAVAGLSLIPSPVREQAKLRHQVQEQAKEEKETLRELTEALEKVDPESLTQEQRAKIRELLETMKLSQEELSEADSMESLSAAAQRLHYKYSRAAADLKTLAGQTKDPKAAGLTGAEALAKAAADQSGKQTAAVSGQEGSQEGNDSGSGDSQEGDGSGQGDSKKGDGSGQGDSKEGDGSGRGEGQEKNGSGTGGGQNGNGAGQDGRNSGTGEDSGTGSGQDGNGSGTGNGRGTGSGDTVHDYVSIPNETAEDSSLTGNKVGDQNSEYFRGQNGLAWEGDHVDYGSVIGEYTDSAYEGIANGKYPSGMEPVIRDYFEQLNK